MSSAAQIAANRRNARKSTGPRSTQGKARAAQNARRHGSTAAPDPGRVETWLRIILGRPEISLGDVLDRGDRMGHALALARAEAGYARARETLDRELARLALPETRAECRAEMNRPLSEFLSGNDPHPALHWRRIGDDMSDLRARTELGKARAKRRRLLERYLREAEGARRRAFRAWVAWLGSDGAPEAAR